MNKKVNNQHKKGYDNGYDDGVKGKKRNWRFSKSWSDYAIKTYKQGYNDGYKQGSIKKKQDDRRADQLNKKGDRTPTPTPTSGGGGCMGVLAAFLVLIILGFSLN